jgi:hypothetical protein
MKSEFIRILGLEMLLLSINFNLNITTANKTVQQEVWHSTKTLATEITTTTKLQCLAYTDVKSWNYDSNKFIYCTKQT